MGWLEKLLGIGNAVEKTGKALDGLFTSDDERLSRAEAMARFQTSQNLVEAQHRTIFVAGWRPFIAWTIGIAMCMQFILFPTAQWIVYITTENLMPVPDIMNEYLWEVLVGMLGLGGLRTYEKQKGLTK